MSANFAEVLPEAMATIGCRHRNLASPLYSVKEKTQSKSERFFSANSIDKPSSNVMSFLKKH